MGKGRGGWLLREYLCDGMFDLGSQVETAARLGSVYSIHPSHSTHHHHHHHYHHHLLIYLPREVVPLIRMLLVLLPHATIIPPLHFELRLQSFRQRREVVGLGVQRSITFGTVGVRRALKIQDRT